MLIKVKNELQTIKEDTKLFFKPVTNFIKLIKFINKLMDTVEDIKVNDNNDVMIEFKNSLVIKSSGHQIYYTKDGRIISSASMISDNPGFEVKDYVERLDIKSLAEKDHNMYIFYMTKYIDFSKFTFREKRN